jgi:hypothetical protein
MACLLIAAWTSIVAVVALGDRPGWALVFAGIAGFALGIELMIVFYEDTRHHTPTRIAHTTRKLRLVRGRAKYPLRGRPLGDLGRRPGGSTVAAPRTVHT